MKKNQLKKFNEFITETLSEEELNGLLDKINDHGIKSLTELEIKQLDNVDTEFDVEIEKTRTLLKNKRSWMLTKEEEDFLNSFDVNSDKVKETFAILNKGYTDIGWYGISSKKNKDYEHNYVNGLEHGEQKSWNKDGELIKYENYKMGKLHGECWTSYGNSYGASNTHETYYIDGKEVEWQQWDAYERNNNSK